MSWNIWIIDEQITISAFRCMSSNIWTLNIWIINERITISASQIEADFRIKKLKLLHSKVQKYPQKSHVTLHVVHPQVGLIFTLVARFNQPGGQLLHPVLERRGKPTNPFQKFPPSDLTPQCRQLAGSARGCQRVSVLQECFAKIASDAPTTLPWWSPAILGAS